MAFHGCGHLEQNDCFEDGCFLTPRGRKDHVWEGAGYKMLRELGGRKHSGHDSTLFLPSSVTCLGVHICEEKVLWAAVKLVPWLRQEGGKGRPKFLQ